MNSHSKNRIPSLDGLRAISVLLVIIIHAFHCIRDYVDIGNIGVRMFFIISSYLITGILHRDFKRSEFSLRKFYFKRLMRTFPAFYFFLFSLFLFLFFVNLFDGNQLWRAPVFLENYHSRVDWNQIQWFVGHSWSLAVEEQFYILISILFFLLNKGLISEFSLTKIVVAVVVIAPVFRLVYLRYDFFPSVFEGSLNRSFETVCDALSTGALGYLLQNKIEGYISKYYRASFFIVMLAVIIIVSFFNGALSRQYFGYVPFYLYNSIGIFLVNLAILFLMFGSMAKSRDYVLTRALNGKILVFIGILSYSIYLWQQPWLYTWSIPLYLKLFGIFACSLISFYFIESPFLKWRDKI